MGQALRSSLSLSLSHTVSLSQSTSRAKVAEGAWHWRMLQIAAVEIALKLNQTNGGMRGMPQAARADTQM